MSLAASMAERRADHHRKSPHLLGENGRGWRATFDWVIQASNMLKTVEGNYVKEKNHTAARSLGNGRR